MDRKQTIYNTHPLDFRKDGSVHFIPKNKEMGESDFRLHFVLPNVKLGRKERVEDLLNEIRVRISKMGTPQAVQILERRKSFLDIGVGLRFDYQAINYLHHQSKKVLLMDSDSNYIQIVPLVCKVFHGYLEQIGKPARYRICTKDNLHIERKIGQQKYRDRERMKQPSRKPRSRERSRDTQGNKDRRQVRGNKELKDHRDSKDSRDRRDKRDYRDPKEYRDKRDSRDRQSLSPYDRRSPRRIRRSRSTSRSRRHDNYLPLPAKQPHRKDAYVRQAPTARKVLIAGIPAGLEYQDIDEQLHKQGFLIDKMIWLKKSDIDLLEVKLQNKSQYDTIQGYGLRLNYQFVLCFTVNQNDSDNLILDTIRDHQARVEFKSQIDKEQALEQLRRFGNIVDCFDERDRRNFLVTFAKRQTVHSIMGNRDHSFQAYLERDIFPIRRRGDGGSTIRHRQKESRSSYPEERSKYY